MNHRNLIGSALRGAIAVTALAAVAAVASPLPRQTSESDGVTIAVKPVDVAAKAPRWSFRVSVSAGGQGVTDDLLHSAYLLNRAADRHEAPIGWKGDLAGRARRTGVLSFKAVKPAPTAIELRIDRPGERAPRVFRWDLDCPCNDPSMHAS